MNPSTVQLFITATAYSLALVLLERPILTFINQMDLSLLPDDILAPVLVYLVGNDLVHLLTVGSKRLAANVLRNSRIWKFLCKGFSKFPFSVYYLPHVTSLEVGMMKYDSDYALDWKSRSLVPSVPQNWLISLKFEFPRCLRVLDAPALSNCAPSLRILSCQDRCTPLELKHLTNVPPTVVIVTLKGKVFSGPLIYSIGDFWALFSPHIEEVDIEAAQLSPPLGNEEGTAVEWPKNLRRLLVDSVPLQLLFANAPSNLEEVRAYPSGWESLPISRIPPTLKCLSCFKSGVMQRQFHLDGPMPPSLVKFKCFIRNMQEGGPKNWLSPNLEKIWNVDILGRELASLLPKLKDLGISDRPDLVALPQSLTKLSIRDPIEFSFIATLPPSLIKLSILLPASKFLGALPRGLKSLILTHHLETRNWKESWIGPLQDWQQLPPTLTHLECCLRDFSSVRCLEVLPETLTSLFFRIESILGDSRAKYDYSRVGPDSQYPLYDAYNLMLWDENLTRHLPKNLESLKISMEAPNECQWPIWVSKLRHLEHLKSLSIDITAYEPPRRGCIAACEKYFGLLPRALEVLCIPIDPFEPIAIDAFSLLPAGLRWLIFWCPQYLYPEEDPSSGSAWQPEPPLLLSNLHFAYLPSGLTSLRWNTSAWETNEALNPKVFELLGPRFLSHFPFQPYHKLRPWTKAWSEYCNGDRWLGASPSDHR